jgi:NDP-sugar pyrophosphorylase family protein
MSQHFHLSDFFDISLFDHKELFNDSTLPWDALKKLENYLAQYSYQINPDTQIDEKAFLINNDMIAIGEGTVVEAGAYIQGPCIIGKNCTIRSGSYIRGNLITGDYVTIGHGTEVKNSIIMSYSAAAHQAYVGNSIIGSHVNLGAGVRLANLRLDKKMIFVKHSHTGQLHPTDLKKLGSIIGDYASLGCNAICNPGSLIGKDSHLYPGSIFSGFLPPHHIFKLKLDAVVVPK